MHRIIDTLAQNRMDELKTMEANQKENEERMKEAVKEAVEATGHMPVISMGIDFGKGKENRTQRKRLAGTVGVAGRVEIVSLSA